MCRFTASRTAGLNVLSSQPSACLPAVLLGGPAAITTTAHKLARIIYKMLKDKVEYIDLGPDYYEEKYKSRIIHSLKHKAESLGFQLIPFSTQ